MDQYLDLINKYRKKGLLLDTKPLLLLLAGASNVRHIKNISRIAGYGETEYALLTELIDQFKKVITTPNILTEVCNLLGHAHLSPYEYSIVGGYIQRFREEYIPSSKAASHEKFCYFGLADIVTLDCARGNYLVLTADGPLYGYLTNMNVDAINFNYLVGI